MGRPVGKITYIEYKRKWMNKLLCINEHESILEPTNTKCQNNGFDFVNFLRRAENLLLHHRLRYAHEQLYSFNKGINSDSRYFKDHALSHMIFKDALETKET